MQILQEFDAFQNNHSKLRKHNQSGFFRTEQKDWIHFKLWGECSVINFLIALV